MTTEEKNNLIETKGKRERSPDYPQYSLRECVDFLHKFIENNEFAQAHMVNVAKFFGHDKKTSTVDREVASMLQYGLFDGSGSGDNRYFQPSKLAKEIYAYKSQPSELVKALQKAALSNKAMQDVWAKWREGIPNRDVIETALLLHFRFSREGAKRFSSVILDNYEYAEFKVRGIIGVPAKTETKQTKLFEEQKEDTDMTTPNGTDETKKRETPPGFMDVPMPTDAGEIAYLVVPEKGLTNDDLDYFVAQVELLRRKVPKKSQ